jgi:hypothetical protein
MDCYSYKVINKSERPVLSNVDVVLILTMEDINRFNEDPFLLNLAKKTIIQYNKGFKKCNKPSTIISSKQDIVHAYYTAFEYLKNYNNVIILEDDALVVNKDILIYDKIDKFIATTNFNIFTFGSFGLFSNYNEDFLKLDHYYFGSAQAIIYSRNARSKLIEDISLSNFNKGHIDITYIGNLTNKFTYKYPLIVQLFPKTENKNSWFSNVFILYSVRLIIAILKLDTNTHGWFLYYSIFRNYILIVKSLLLLLIITSTFYFNIYNVKLVKTNIV